MHDLIPGNAALGVALSDADVEAIDYFRQREKSPATLAAYEADWHRFSVWCNARCRAPLPATYATVCAHIADIAKNGYAVASIGRRLAGIAYHHEIRGFDDPTTHKTIKVVMAGIRRSKAGEPKRLKTPALAPMVQKMLDSCGDDVVGVRDRALISVAFACALRRSDLVALNVDDIIKVPGVLRITIRRSKTDQQGAGQVIALPRGVHMRPVEALQDWRQAAEVTFGQGLFRAVLLGGRLQASWTPECLCRRAKLYAAKVGLDPRTIGAHSMRSGVITSAAEHARISGRSSN
jgi:site-specific recombinase XerD